MENLEQLKEIVKNAPEGATHFDEDGYLMFSDGDYYHVSSLKPDLWVVCEYDETPIQDARSLSDIKRIIELMEGKKKAYQAYVALEEIKQKYNGENKIAKELLNLAYECDEFALSGDLRKDIKEFLGCL